MGLWESGYATVWANKNKVPPSAQAVIDRGWAKIAEKLTPRQNIHRKYMWSLKATPAGKSEYTRARNQRHKKMMERQVRLFNGKRK